MKAKRSEVFYRIENLISVCEGREELHNVYMKAMNALITKPFTGILKLSNSERKMLKSLEHKSYLTAEERKSIRFYTMLVS